MPKAYPYFVRLIISEAIVTANEPTVIQNVGVKGFLRMEWLTV